MHINMPITIAKTRVTIDQLAGMVQRGFVDIETKFSDKIDVLDNKIDVLDNKVTKGFDKFECRFDKIEQILTSSR